MINRLINEINRVGIVTFLTVFTAFLQFLAGILVARFLGPEGRGLITVVISVAGIASIIAAMGTGIAFRKILPEGRANVKGFLRATLRLTTFLGIPVIGITIICVGWLVDITVLSPVTAILFMLFGLTNILWLQGKEALAALGKIRLGAVISTVGSALFLAVCGVTVIAFGGSVDEILIAYVVMNILQSILAWMHLKKEFQGTQARGTRTILKSGPSYLPYFLGQESVFRLDRLLIGVYSTSNSVGLFAVGAGLAEILRLPVLASSQYVLLDTANGRLRVMGVMKHVGLWAGIVLLVSAVLWPIAPIVIPWLYGEQFVAAVDTFRVLLVAQVCLVPFIILSRALVGLGDRSGTIIPSLIGVGAMVIVAPNLISQFGALGGAITAFVAYLSMSSAAFLAIYRSRKKDIYNK